ncbi:sensitivity to red-light reduced protein [Actinomortierella ambigua]|uniref:Sensitivity to red-light reduced protein n=1 Tax=Actinomortierella ambigua TaxID=1343610 RepID=A0A9P6Q422_9FUNG|nr:sensitivity to red-light reduced protein [Actinomortierella ambigua]KAG0257656.1 sensitivity to red-light reduced protein [Actinomortierella ambigua]
MCSTSLKKPLAEASMAFSAAATSPIIPPSSPASSVSDSMSEPSVAPLNRKLKVMIVDDNTVNLTILARLLNKHFSDMIQLTSVMNSGVSALDQLSKDEVDLILMDIDMPVLSGVQTTTLIRNDNEEHHILQQNKNVPIIAVTTSDGEAQRELYRQVGMSDCVSKPIAVPKLRSAIEEAIKAVPRLATG